MDILLYKDGHLSISESPLQGKENNLDDVVMLVSNPQDGDTLTYKGGKWVNGEGGGGGGGMMLLTLTITETSATLDATYAEVKAAMQAGTLVGYLMTMNGVTGLVLAAAYEDAHDPTHGDPYTVYFFSLDGGSSMPPMYADTEDGQLHVSNGG